MKTLDYYKTLFEPTDWVCYGKEKFAVGVYPVKKMPEWAQFISLNPLEPRTRRKDKYVSRYQNFLIEIDDLPLDQQIDYIKSLGVPYSTLVYSGKKSYHAVISLETPVELNEYKRIVKWLYSAIPHADHSTGNPSRFTRAPNAVREDTGKTQDLIEIRGKVKNEDLYAWLAQHPEPSFSVPSVSIASAADLSGLRPESKLLLDGFWTPGRRHYEVYRVACDLAQNGFDKQQSASIISKSFTFTDSFDESELHRTIESAFNRVADEVKAC